MIPQHICRLCISPDSKTAYAQSRMAYHWIHLHKLDASHPSGLSLAYVPWLAARFSRQVYDMHLSTSEWMRGQVAGSLTRCPSGCAEYLFCSVKCGVIYLPRFHSRGFCNASANPWDHSCGHLHWQNPDPTTTRQASGQQEVRFFALILCTKSRTPIAIASKWSVVYLCCRAFFHTQKQQYWW